MSTTDRQNRLLLAEDWKKVYQSYRNADFKSYDFDNLRRAMIGYLRKNYPEDFNDYIESSEYLALIDLIAFLGQNLAFRVDLNARENYLELADRRESVLRLARLLSYNPKRNQAANGFLKFDTVQTTETIVDSNGVNLAGQTVTWNDPSNTNWSEQFTKILNATLPQNGIIGKPNSSGTINGVLTQQYRFNANNSDVPTYSFSKNVNGQNTQFEVTSCNLNEETNSIAEEAPLPGNNLGFVYREDGRGNGSSNTGYFVHFRQGLTRTGNFNIDNPASNQIVNIDATNINNSDVWLYKLNSLGFESALWEKVDSTVGNNVVYNSTAKGKRNMYAIQTRVEDRINLVFADGIFGNLPRGSFRVYYRQSANRQMVVRPEDLTNISVAIDYISRSGKIETLTIGLGLKSNVDNASISETSASIRKLAPQTYYSQDRMVTAEDYQIVPLGVNQEIIKVKSVNRTSSGISRYFDLKDPTAKYSSTNIYANDGVLYKEEYTNKYSFTFNSQTDIEGNIENLIQPLLSSRDINNFYNSKYAKIIVSDLNAKLEQSSAGTNLSTGFLSDSTDQAYQVGSFTGGALRFIEAGCLVKFVAPTGYHFMPNGTLMLGEANHTGSRTYKWVRVVSVIGNGTEVQADGSGPITFNDVIPQGAILQEVKPKLNRFLSTDIKTQIIDQVFAYKTFGLRYDQGIREWRVITKENLNAQSEFSNGKAGDISNAELDASWLLLFETNGETYTITQRSLRYVFESDTEVNFYFDSTKKIYDNKTGQLIKDKVELLSINTLPDTTTPYTNPITWEIVKEFRDVDGYINAKKVEVGFYDQNDDGVVDDPDIFEIVVDELVNSLSKYIILKKIVSAQGSNIFVYDNSNSVNVVANEVAIGAYSQYDNGQVFYIVDIDAFKFLNGNVLDITANYKAFVGRDDLRFQYVHSADENNRIDPSSSNLVDTYILTRQYDTQFRQYLRGAVSSEPLPPSTDELFLAYGQEINKKKSISDEVIYHPVRYKVLFGDKATEDMQATFKIVKNPDQVTNDNDVKTRVIQAINQFFVLDNWDFGDNFSFTELATYIMNATAPDISNIVIVPKQDSQRFGSLYEIKAEDFEIFVSGATVDNIEIIDSITATKIKAENSGVVTASSNTKSGIQSSVNTGVTYTSTTTTTSSSSSSGSSSGSSGSSGGSGGYGY